MRYQNIGSMFCSFFTDRQTDRRTDGRTDRQNYDSQDRASLAASRGKNHKKETKHTQKSHTHTEDAYDVDVVDPVCKFSKSIFRLFADELCHMKCFRPSLFLDIV